MQFTRITVDPAVMAGVPTIRAMRIPVATVVLMVADGMTSEEICSALLRKSKNVHPGRFGLCLPLWAA